MTTEAALFRLYNEMTWLRHAPQGKSTPSTELSARKMQRSVSFISLPSLRLSLLNFISLPSLHSVLYRYPHFTQFYIATYSSLSFISLSSLHSVLYRYPLFTQFYIATLSLPSFISLPSLHSVLYHLVIYYHIISYSL